MHWMKATVLTSALLAAAPIAARADCSAELANIEKALRTGTLEGTEGLANNVQNSRVCAPSEKDKAKALFAMKLVNEAKQIDPALKDTRAIAMIDKAAGLDADWRALELQGRIRRDAGKYMAAAQSFQEAINRIQYSDEETDSSAAAGKSERASLAAEADEAKHLAAVGPRGALVASRDRDGNPGGVFSPAVDRGAVAARVPTPILFDFDSARLTQIGIDAAQEMVTVLKDRNPRSITVAGHTDRVGTAAYNMDLSKRRAEAVVAFLKDKGITARIVSVGKGFSEPRQLSEGNNYSQEQIDELNRRVEFDWKK
jgi:outer membrane protein OmpA-like peptidoglycan-associated protein